MFIYTTELFADIAHEVQPLLQSHWDEVEADLYGKQEYRLDEKQFALLEDLGFLHISTVRTTDSALCGYAAFTLTQCYHKKNYMIAALEGLFLTQSARKGLAVFALLRHAEKAVQERGAKIMQYSSPVSRPCDVLYKRLGAKMTETVWHKELV